MGSLGVLTTLAALGLALILCELLVARRRGVKAYSLSATLANLANGAGALLAGLAFSVFLLYGSLEARLGLFDLEPARWTTWALAFVLLDFVFYWAHRLCHAVPLLWAMHAVHHQSDEYNLSVGLRAPWLQPLMYAPFTALLAFSGIPVEVMAVVYLIQQIWKMVIHTQLIGSLGPLEWVLMTPRHHAVHHAYNARYRDRNHGGVFVLWDRLFGTFQPLAEAPVFGTGEATGHNPLRNNLQPWRQLVRRAARASGAGAALRAVLWSPSRGSGSAE
jgi:sterol desaturase/sphingolipid hydroxylase (fatty acid hydroxylase superfamily)